MKIVTTLRPKGKITKEVLIEIGTDQNLEDYLILCKWKDGGFSVGWSDMKGRDLTFLNMLADYEIKKHLFGME